MSRWAVANWSRWDLFIGDVLSRRVAHALFYRVVRPLGRIAERKPKTLSLGFLSIFNKSHLLVIVPKLRACEFTERV